MDIFRRRLRLVDPHRVQVLISPEDRGAAEFECTPCSLVLQWVEEKCWFECPACGYELTVVEAQALVDRAVGMLKVRKKDLKCRRKRCR